MPYIIPNASDTGAGQRFSNINLAEPDSLDVEALGNRANWVRFGGEVTATSGTISVAAGAVVIDGTPYSFPAVTGLVVSAPIESRIDLVIVRLTGTTCTVRVLSGAESNINPTLPRSASVLYDNGDYDPNFNYTPETDVLLAALYVGASAIQQNAVVDKRITNSCPVTYSPASVPAPRPLDVLGDKIIVAGVTYIKDGPASWTPLASHAYVASSTEPVGSIIAWGGIGAFPSPYYLPCDGRSYQVSDYPDLYAAIGRRYSDQNVVGPITTFNVPNLDNKMLKGVDMVSGPESTAVRTAVGTQGGNSTNNRVTLSTANMPAHTHAVSVANHPALTHSYVEPTHGHTPGKGTSLGEGGNQEYDAGFYITTSLNAQNQLPNRLTSGHTHAGEQLRGPFYGISPFTGQRVNPPLTSHPAQAHTVTVSTVGGAGSPPVTQSFSIDPDHLKVRYYIKAIGSTPAPLAERYDVVTLEPSNGTVVLDMAFLNKKYVVHTIDGDVTYETVNTLPGQSATIKMDVVVGNLTDDPPVTITYPEWNWVGSGQDLALDSEVAILTVSYFGEDDSDAVAAVANNRGE